MNQQKGTKKVFMENKLLVKKRFLRAFSCYEKEATVQREMAEHLLEALSFNSFYSSVLEIGAGTGLFTRLFLKKYACNLYLATDIVAECASFFEGLPVAFLAVDGERVPFRRESFALIVSNATFQWFLHPKESLNVLKELLIPGGILAFSSFGPETMKELDRQKPLPGLLSLEKLLAIKPEDFEVLRAEAFKKVLYFDSAWAALSHVRKTGSMGHLRANWSLRSLKDLVQRYEKKRTPKGLPLTFEPILMIWRKKL